MKNRKYLPSMFSIVLVIACLCVTALGQSSEDKNQFATSNSNGSSVRWDIKATHSAVTLTVLGPDGEVFTQEFHGGNSPEFRITDKKGERLPDGVYTYELRLTPVFGAGVKDALKAAREKGTESEVKRDLKKRGQLSSETFVQSGSFSILNGTIVVAGASEGGSAATVQPRSAPAATTSKAAATTSRAVASAPSARINYKVNRHHPRFMFFDQVIPDDLIVQGSICSGFDCVNNENFGTDTIRVKENNVRIQFDDTSVSAGFATNNWQI
ncbi:MAG TPA: hypothetical protein VFY67_04110, partial [Pyrinomonadaceae bacterium]|nr:hypothetical protein [Pyrinomonadaceae bacterium]